MRRAGNGFPIGACEQDRYIGMLRKVTKGDGKGDILCSLLVSYTRHANVFSPCTGLVGIAEDCF